MVHTIEPAHGLTTTREALTADGPALPALSVDPASLTPQALVHDHAEHCPCCRVEDAPADQPIAPRRADGADNPYGKVSLGADAAADQITRYGRSWDDGDAAQPGVTITYGYLAEDALRADDSNSYRAFTVAEIAAVERAIRLIEDVAGVDFVRDRGADGSGYVSDTERTLIDLDAVEGSNGGRARTAFSGDTIRTAEVSIGERGLEDEGSYAFRTALHEISHALGLSHPGEYDGDGARDYASQAEYFEDSGQYTVMSYWDEGETGADFGRGQATNLLLHDVTALQELYGANAATRTGDDTYGFGAEDDAWALTGARDFLVGTIWDAGGRDLIDVSGFGQDQLVDLTEEAFSSTGGMTWNLSVARGAVIEEARTGAGDDTLRGNDADNVLMGGEGADLLFGGAGGDLLVGDVAADFTA